MAKGDSRPMDGNIAKQKVREGVEGPRTPRKRRCQSPTTNNDAQSISPPVRPSMREVAALTEALLVEGRPLVRCLSTQALAGHVDEAALRRTSHMNRRDGAVGFFAEAFEARQLRDEWFVALIILLDRYAVASESLRNPRNTMHDKQAEWLAAVLMVLKQTPCEAELDMGLRDVVYRVSRIQKQQFLKMWPDIVNAEFRICHVLNFRVALPSPMDLLLHIGLKACNEARKSEPNWPGFVEGFLPAPTPESQTPTPCFVLLAAYLLELMVSHAPMDIYRKPVTPYLLAYACLYLAAHAFGEPLQCVLTELEDPEMAPQHFQGEFMQKIHMLWAQPPADSRVVRKWKRRAESIGGALPLAPIRLRPGMLTPRRDSTPQPPQAFQTPQRTKDLATLSRVHSHAKEPQPSFKDGLIRANNSTPTALDDPTTKTSGVGKSLKEPAIPPCSATRNHKSSSTVESRMPHPMSSTDDEPTEGPDTRQPSTTKDVTTKGPAILSFSTTSDHKSSSTGESGMPRPMSSTDVEAGKRPGTRQPSAAKDVTTKGPAILPFSTTSDHKSSSSVESRTPHPLSSSDEQAGERPGTRQPSAAKDVMTKVSRVINLDSESNSLLATCDTRKKTASQDKPTMCIASELNSNAMDAKVSHVINIDSESDPLLVPPGYFSGIHNASRGTSKLDNLAAVAKSILAACQSPRRRAAPASPQEAMLVDDSDSGTRREWQRPRPTSPGPTPGPSSGPLSISSSGSANSGSSGCSGAGLDAQRRKAKRIKILGVPSLEKRQVASLDTAVADTTQRAKEATGAVGLATAATASAALLGPMTRSRSAKLTEAAGLPATASTALTGPSKRARSAAIAASMQVTTSVAPCRRRSFDNTPLTAEAAPQQQKQVGSESVIAALKQAFGVASTKVAAARSLSMVQNRAASVPTAPTAVLGGLPMATPLPRASVVPQRPPSHKKIAIQSSFETMHAQCVRQLSTDAHAAQFQQQAAEPIVDAALSSRRPLAQIQSQCLPQDASQHTPSNACCSSFERRPSRKSLLKRKRTEQLGNMNPVLPTGAQHGL